MSENTIGPDGLRDDERRACGCRDLGCARFHLGTHVFRARLIESRAETEAEKRAHTETRAALDFAGRVTCECCGSRHEDHTYTCRRCVESLNDTWKARAEKAEAERDRLRAAVVEFVAITGRENKVRLPTVECDRFVTVEFDPDLLARSRALLGEVKP